MELQGKAALVTGAGKRIGRAIALSLAERGWAVAVHYRASSREAEDVVEEIRRRGRQAVAIRADLAREADVQALIPRAASLLGPLTCLINNASLFFRDGVLDATRESWDAHIETNLRAPFVLMQNFARQLPSAEHGCIINILDQRVWNLTPDFISYTLSKSALWTLTRTMALALAPRIRVNGIGPGPTLPNERQSENDFREQCESVPLQRGTTPDEICDAIQFILHAPAMIGQMLALDGGEHLGYAQPRWGFVAAE